MRVARLLRCTTTETNEIKNAKLLLALYAGCRAYVKFCIHMYWRISINFATDDASPLPYVQINIRIYGKLCARVAYTARGEQLCDQ